MYDIVQSINKESSRHSSCPRGAVHLETPFPDDRRAGIHSDDLEIHLPRFDAIDDIPGRRDRNSGGKVVLEQGA